MAARYLKGLTLPQDVSFEEAVAALKKAVGWRKYTEALQTWEELHTCARVFGYILVPGRRKSERVEAALLRRSR